MTIQRSDIKKVVALKINVHKDFSEISKISANSWNEAIDAVLAILRPHIDAGAEGWRTIDSATKTGAQIIMADTTSIFGHVGFGHWYKIQGRFVWDNYLGKEPDSPTHWMPLPAAPKGTKE